MKVLILGAGHMDAAMALRLVETNHDVTVWNRSPQPLEPLRDAGVTVTQDVAEAVAHTPSYGSNALTAERSACETTYQCAKTAGSDVLASGGDVFSLDEDHDIAPGRGLAEAQLLGLASPRKQVWVFPDTARSLDRDPSVWSLFGQRCAGCPGTDDSRLDALP